MSTIPVVCNTGSVREVHLYRTPSIKYTSSDDLFVCSLNILRFQMTVDQFSHRYSYVR